MKRIAVYVVAISLFAVNGFSQESIFGSTGRNGYTEWVPGGRPFVPDIDLIFGTSFGNIHGGTLLTSSVSPRLRFTPTNRLQLVVGSVISTSRHGVSFAGLNQGNAGNVFTGHTSAAFYALGAYQVNARVTITGSGWWQHNNFNPLELQMNPRVFDTRSGGMTMGMEYRVTDNLRIGTEIGFTRGGNPFQTHYHPMFSRNPFSRFIP